jgi:hypothetical protein
LALLRKVDARETENLVAENPRFVSSDLLERRNRGIKVSVGNERQLVPKLRDFVVERISLIE